MFTLRNNWKICIFTKNCLLCISHGNSTFGIVRNAHNVPVDQKHYQQIIQSQFCHICTQHSNTVINAMLTHPWYILFRSILSHRQHCSIHLNLHNLNQHSLTLIDIFNYPLSFVHFMSYQSVHVRMPLRNLHSSPMIFVQTLI